MKDLVYIKLCEYRENIIKYFLYSIPIVFILYLLNIHGYIFSNSIIFRLDIYFGIMTFILGFIYIYDIIYNKKKISIENIFMILFLLFSLISVFFSVNKDVALYGYHGRYEGFFTLLFYGLLYLNTEKVKDNKTIKTIIISLMVTIFINLFFVILELTGVFKIIFTQYSSKNIIALTSNTDFLGSLVCTLSIISLGFFLSNKYKILSFFSFIAGYLILLLTGTTGPFISFIITFIIMIIYLSIKKKINYKKMIISIIIIVSMYSLDFMNGKNISNDLVSHTKYIFNSSDKMNTNRLGNGRIGLWIKTWDLIKEKPLIGYGPDNLGLVYKRDPNEKYNLDKAHNIYLHIWVSSGVFALISYLMFVLFTVIKGLKNKDTIICILTFGIIAYSIQGFFNINVLEVTPYFYVIMGLILNRECLTSNN